MSFFKSQVRTLPMVVNSGNYSNYISTEKLKKLPFGTLSSMFIHRQLKKEIFSIIRFACTDISCNGN